VADGRLLPGSLDHTCDAMLRDALQLLAATGWPICEIRLGLDRRVRAAWNTEALFGWTPDQLVGRLLWDVIRPDGERPSDPGYERMCDEILSDQRHVFCAAGPLRHAKGHLVRAICATFADRADGWQSPPIGLVCRYVPLDVLVVD
jgi:PAS domain-containing protein